MIYGPANSKHSPAPFLKKRFVSIMALLLLMAGSVFAENDTLKPNLFAMQLEELMNQEVSIATKSPVKVKQAPAVVTVITKEEIENLPVQSLYGVLQLVPGFEITPRLNAFEGVGFRGVKDNRYTARFLVLLDGQPYNQIFYGNAFDFKFFGIDFYSIERIEIIRGPGSALYGRNAFLAVINIITKSAENNEGLQIKAQAGSYSSSRANVSFGKTLSKSNNFLVSAGYQNSKGTNQEGLDIFGRPFTWNRSSKNFYLNNNISLGDFSIFLSGTYGENGAQLYDTYIKRLGLYYSANYSKQVSELLKVKATVFGHNMDASEHFESMMPNDPVVLMPPTDTTPAVALKDLYPDGVYYNPYYSEYIYGGNFETELLFSKNNQLLAGIQVNAYGVYDVEIKSNVNLRTNPPVPYIGYTRGNLLQDSLGWFENGKHSYSNIAFYVQDIWYPTSNLGITFGGRLDLDSQIGPLLNPRIGLTWLMNDVYNIKALFGTAYRAPSPTEQYQTLGFALGNENLKPERIKTFELAFQQALPRFDNQFNIYYNIIDDMIYAETDISVDINNTYRNLGTNESFGIEIESRQKLFNWLYSFVNYTYNQSENTTTVDSISNTFKHVDIAPHKLNAGINLLLPYDLRFTTTLMYRSKMEKFKYPGTDFQQEVSKDPVGNYTVVNAKLMYKKEDFPLALHASIYNLLNTKYYSQDNENERYPLMPGISFLAGVSLSF